MTFIIRFTLKFIFLKIRLLLFFIFAFCTFAQSQKPFSSRALDYSWLYKSFVWAQVSNRYSSKLDTPLANFNGKDYYSFENFKIADSGTKVFALTGAKEYLLMDYSLNVGDTLVSNYTTSPYKLRVIAKSKVKIENDSLWRMELKSVAHPTNVPALIWIESLGCLNAFHPINWPSKFNFSDLGFNLDCVIHLDTSILRIFGKNCAIDNSLTNSNKIWHTWGSNNNGDLKFSVPYYFTNHDTTLFGKKYRTMNQINRFVRYDSLSGKYFILSNYNNGQELLVYSDRVKIGDTMAIIHGTIPDTVTKIEYKWVEDEYRKVINTGRDIYISGIGSVNRVMWNNHLAAFPEFASGNICFEGNGTIRYHYPFFYQNREQCEITSSIQNVSIRSISFFPNPVQTSLNFNTSDKKEFKIRNSLGVLVLEGECEEKIDLSTLPKGIYFIELQSKNQTSHFKFLKE
jgi:hypothetical protein